MRKKAKSRQTGIQDSDYKNSIRVILQVWRDAEVELFRRNIQAKSAWSDSAREQNRYMKA